MKYPNRLNLAVIAALAAIPAFTRPAAAQNRIDTSGHAIDANTQVGSGGYNVPNNNPTAAYQTYQNAIATNNVGNGFAFHGRTVGQVNLGVGYTDPFAFRGLLPGQGVDQFVANSTGVPTMADPTASSRGYAQPVDQSQVYYGTANHASAPPGTVTGPWNQNFVPSQPITQSPQDTRLGAINYSGQSDQPIIPKPNELLLPGPVDTSSNPATTAQKMLAASPLYGMRQWDTSSSMQVSPTTDAWQPGWGQTPLQQGFAPNLPSSLQQSRVSQMQQELLEQGQFNTSATSTNLSASSQLQPLTPGGGTSSGPLQPLLNTNSQLQSNSLSPQAGDVSTSQSNRQYLSSNTLPPPGMESAQYAQLQRAYQDYLGTHNLTDEQANQRFQQIQKLRIAAAQNAEQGGNVFSPGSATPSANPGNVPSPDQQSTPPSTPPLQPSLHPIPPVNQQNKIKPNFTTMPSNIVGLNMTPAAAPPIAIDSYATGIKAPGLSGLITTGESQMQSRQYDKAISTFNTAVDVAPNNPLILMARANAELGGGYYAQANADIHLAVAQDPAILMGQYDLQKHLGNERLKSLIADLKDISQTKRDDSLHSFLLAYVYYNSHHIGQAADWVAIADNRANGQDPALIQMKKYWNFNEDQQPVAAPSSRPSMDK